MPASTALTEEATEQEKVYTHEEKDKKRSLCIIAVVLLLLFSSPFFAMLCDMVEGKQEL